MSKFYHSCPISEVFPGSSYAVEFSIYVASGNPNYGISLENSASLVLWQNSFTAINGEWVTLKKIVTVLSYGESLRLYFYSLDNTYMGTLAYIDDVRFMDNKDMIALGVLQIFPGWDMKREVVQNRADHRTKGGRLYSYQWGDYERFTIPLDYVQNSKAAIINSWWASDALIWLKIYSGGVWETNTCYLMNDRAPMQDREKPYSQYMRGTLRLETF